MGDNRVLIGQQLIILDILTMSTWSIHWFAPWSDGGFGYAMLYYTKHGDEATYHGASQNPQGCLGKYLI